MLKHNAIKSALEKKKIKLINAARVEDSSLQLNNIHTKDNSIVAICNKKDEFSQWFSFKNDLMGKINNVIDIPNTYISNNSFKGFKRRLNNLHSLNCFWVDLDYYKIPSLKNKTPEEVISLLRKKGLFKKVEPSFFIYSGQGLYIYYLIENADAKSCLGIWQKIEDTITEMFEKFGADPKSTDAVHVLRLAGTINGKTGNIAKFIYNSTKEYKWEQQQEDIRRYTISQMATALLPELPYSKAEYAKIKAERKAIKESKKAKKEKKTISLYNLYTLNWARLQDLDMLVTLREGNCEGIREFMCFLFRYWSCCYIKDTDKALEEVLEFNKGFSEPLAETEVIKATVSAEKAYTLWEKTFNDYMDMMDKPNIVQFFRKAGCYIYSNKTLIKQLSITEDEMQSLKTMINLKEKNRRNKDYRNEWTKTDNKKKRRNADGMTAREQAKQENIARIEEMMNEGMKQKDIASVLCLSKGLVSMYSKEIKEKELNINKPAKHKIVYDYTEIIDMSEVEAILA